MSEMMERLQAYLRKFRGHLERKEIEDGEVFWVSRNTKLLFELGDVFDDGGSLQSAIRTIARVGGNVRIMIYDNDGAELKAVDSFRHVLWDGFID